MTQVDFRDELLSTYRYLRIAIVVVVLTLAVSLSLERAAATCWQGSVSAYYYTPVHSVFVAALGVVGVALFVIRGGTTAEEVILNQAAFLAPVVAFVPTGWSSDDCPSNLTATSKTAVDQLLRGNQFFSKFSHNNLIAFVVGSVVAVALVGFVAWAFGRKESRLLQVDLLVPAIGTAGVVVAGVIWRVVSPSTFNTHAHSYSAILMFALVGVVIILTALRDPKKGYRIFYLACAGAMVAGFLVVISIGLLMTWRHEVLILEVVEATAFLVFWFLQTIQLWNEHPTARRRAA